MILLTPATDDSSFTPEEFDARHRLNVDATAEHRRILASLSPSEVMGFWTLGGDVSRRQLDAACAELDKQMEAALAKKHQIDAVLAAIASKMEANAYPRRRNFLPVMPDLKECTKCHRRLPALAFHVANDRADGLQTHCRQCRRDAAHLKLEQAA